MAIFQLSSFPIEQVPNLVALEQRLGASFAAREFPHRLLAFSQACSMRPAIVRVQREQVPVEQWLDQLRTLRQALTESSDGNTRMRVLSALAELTPEIRAELARLLDPQSDLAALMSSGIGEERHDEALIDWSAVSVAIDRLLWRLPWTKEMIRFYEALEQRHLRSARYMLLTWEPPDIAPAALLTTLRYAFQRPVTRLDYLPSVLPCAYREHPTRLEPHEAGQPWLALLHSYDMQDEWDATTLHPLLAASFDVALAIDIVTLPRVKAQRLAEMAYNAARLLASDTKLLDTRAQRVTGDAQLVLHEMARQTLHEIQIAVLVGGRTPEELEVNVADIRDRLGPRLRLMRAAGCQGEVLKLFSQTPRNRIDAPLKPRTQLSHAVGCMAGIVGLHRANATDGIFLGVDAVRRAPICMDLFKNNQAAHTIVLGKSGYGKTVFLNTVAERAAAVGGMQVIGIDGFRNGFRIAEALAGAFCYPIGLDQTINILDIVFGADADGGWLPNQVMHVVGPDTALSDMPILTDLLSTLEQDGSTIAHDLALDLRYLIYGTDKRDVSERTPEGQAFCGHTTVDWNFLTDVVYYDFSRVPALLLPFYYLQAIGAINRYLRRPGRDTRRKIFLQIDEFGYASQVEDVARLAVDICKTARKYGVGIMLVDQNPLTFLETDSGRQIFENAAARILFHLEDIAARQMGEAMSDLTGEHIAFLPQAQPGECLAVIKNDVYRVNVELHPLEIRAFVGS